VTGEQTGTPRRLEPAVELSAYRIVQESLTNALRYAAPGTASVLLAWSDGDLALEVVDTGAVARPDVFPDAGGRGLVGLRERVATLGGELWSGPTEDGGHRVAARLPVRPA
jgi:signal transduction histidine kinase